MANPKARFDIVAGDKTKAAFKSFNSSIKTSTGNISRITGAVLGLAGVGGFGALIKSSLDAGDKVQKLSIRLGASTEALSQYRHVAELSGVTFETLTMGWQRMTRRIAEAAQGTGEARGALKELGIEAQEINRLAPEDQFEVLADALNDVENSADKVRLSMKLFDSEGVSLIQTMGGGAAGIREMRNEADSLGLTLNQLEADQMAAANDAFTRMRTSIIGVGNSLAIEFAGGISEVAEALQFDLPIAANKSIVILNDLESSLNGAWVVMQEMMLRRDEIDNGFFTSNKITQKLAEEFLGFNPDQLRVRREMVNHLRTERDFSANESRLAELRIVELQKQQADFRRARLDNTGKELSGENSNGSSGEVENNVTVSQEKALAAHRLFLMGRIDAIEQAGKTENQRFFDSLINRELIVEEAQARGIGSEERNAEILVGIAQQREDRILSITKASSKENEKIEKQRSVARLSIATGMLNNLSTLMSSDSKKQFEIGKKAALAGALISGASAVVSSYAAGAKIGGPVLGAAFAVTAGIATKMHIDSIRNQQFGGGGAVGGSAGQGATPVFQANPNSGLPQQNILQQDDRAGGVLEVNFNGDMVGWNEQIRDQIIDDLREAMDQRDVVIFSRNSRQAIEAGAA